MTLRFLAQVILKKYKDPHIYTAVIKYSFIKPLFNSLLYFSDDKLTGITCENYLIHCFVQPLQGIKKWHPKSNDIDDYSLDRVSF